MSVSQIKRVSNCDHCNWLTYNTHPSLLLYSGRITLDSNEILYSAYLNDNKYAYSFSVILHNHELDSINEFQKIYLCTLDFKQRIDPYFLPVSILINRTIKYHDPSFINNKEHAHSWIKVLNDQRFDSFFGTKIGCSSKISPSFCKTVSRPTSRYDGDHEYFISKNSASSLDIIFKNHDYYIFDYDNCLLVKFQERDESIKNKLMKKLNKNSQFVETYDREAAAVGYRHRSINQNNCINYEEMREINIPLYTHLLNHTPASDSNLRLPSLFGKSKQQYISDLDRIESARRVNVRADPRRKPANPPRKIHKKK